MKGATRFQSVPRQVSGSATTCPISDPNTAKGAATCGSTAHAHTDSAASAKAKPDRPCTKPASTAPPITMAR
jgi:hypothetical protein